MRFFVVQVKDPDGFYYAFSSVTEEQRKLMRKYISGEEYAEILFDLETGIARLLEINES